MLSMDSKPKGQQRDEFPRPRVMGPRTLSIPSIPVLTIPLSDIEEFVETTIVLKKDKKNELGVSVVGGSDTYLEAICVDEVHRDGVAYKDGRLKRGDIILAVNDHTLRDLPGSDAVKALREATSPVRLVVLRENPHIMFTFEENPTRILTVELKKTAVTERLGLSLMQRQNSEGVFITWVEPGSIAARHGRVFQGDRILEINGQSIGATSQKEVAKTIRNLDGAIVFLLGRIPSQTQSIQEWARCKVGSPGRIRTSTWSYTDQSKKKLQSQRPSLPTSNTGKDTFLFSSIFRSKDSKRGRSSGETTPRKGVVQGLRLTLSPETPVPPIVVTKIDEESQRGSKSLVPSIEVTGC